MYPSQGHRLAYQPWRTKDTRSAAPCFTVNFPCSVRSRPNGHREGESQRKSCEERTKTVMLCIRTGRLHAAPQLRCREPPPPRCPATGSAKAGQHLTRGTLSKTPKYLRKPGQVEVSDPGRKPSASQHLRGLSAVLGSWNIHPKLKPASQQAPHMCLEFLFSLFPLSFLRIAWQLRITKHLRKAYSIMKKNRKSNPRGNV